ncbi:MAG TPA: metalloregulator ArsR/SmtB family transcription factor [Syntrophorhabdaceae bacterium]|mgnify:FL=1|nr:metalloregulator ArsR/SmtB family transcription factor [Syntrophorhabdaceae bacterium]HQM81040.1 metalloregulator ArsR/SmtB family transcription factor [Syntrophorhabdaceae bacterium]
MKELLSIFKALSDETRLRILKLLENGELCVCHIVAAVDMSQPKVSFHLKVLKDSGLVKDRREGKWMHYRLNESDLLKRLLFLSIAEQVREEEIEGDRQRLEAFIASRPEEFADIAAGCCGRA